jgi:uncharacterized protein YajQ (UPF0234 family)
MPSFDIVSEVNQVEVHNAVDQTNKEVSTRFDFKGSDARVEMNEKEKTLTVFADDDFKLCVTYSLPNWRNAALTPAASKSATAKPSAATR